MKDLTPVAIVYSWQLTSTSWFVVAVCDDYIGHNSTQSKQSKSKQHIYPLITIEIIEQGTAVWFFKILFPSLGVTTEAEIMHIMRNFSVDY